MNRLDGGGSPGVEGLEGEGDTDGKRKGEGGWEGTPGRMIRPIGGGGPFGSDCGLAKLDGECVDRWGGGGGGGRFDLGLGKSRFFEELLCAGYPMSDRRVASQNSSSGMGRGCSLGIDFWYCCTCLSQSPSPSKPET